MITKELFVEFLEQFQRFNSAFERIEKALMGNQYSSNLYESDWYDSVGYMLDIFLESHFTEFGCDLINAYLFDDCREFWADVDKNLFEDKRQEHYVFDSLSELYDTMLKLKNDYFLNV